MLSPFFKALYL